MVQEKFGFHVLEPSFHDETLSVLHEAFLSSDPVGLYLGITEPKDFNEFYEPLVKTAIIHNVCIGAFDATKNEVCGVVISLHGQLMKPDLVPLDKLQSIGQRQMITMARGLFQGDNLGTDNYLEICVLAVKPEYSNQGIGTELVKRSVELARELKCSYSTIVCSNEFSRRASVKQGFIEKERICYSQYVDPVSGKKIFKNMPKLHEYCCALVKDL